MRSTYDRRREAMEDARDEAVEAVEAMEAALANVKQAIDVIQGSAGEICRLAEDNDWDGLAEVAGVLCFVEEGSLVDLIEHELGRATDVVAEKRRDLDEFEVEFAWRGDYEADMLSAYHS